jgi:hypothetical protein
MAKQPISRIRVSLPTTTLTDAERLALITGIQKVAPSSALIKVPAIATSITALGTNGAALKAASDQVAEDLKQLKLDEATRDQARADTDLAFVTLKALVTQSAQSATDVTSVGLEVLNTVRPTPSKPAVPGPIVVLPTTKSGTAKIGVSAKGELGYLTVAEVSTDPIGAGTWTLLPGSGKQRKLSGYASGTKLWVRFAAVRYGQMSDWSVPVLLTVL